MDGSSRNMVIICNNRFWPIPILIYIYIYYIYTYIYIYIIWGMYVYIYMRYVYIYTWFNCAVYPMASSLVFLMSCQSMIYRKVWYIETVDVYPLTQRWAAQVGPCCAWRRACPSAPNVPSVPCFEWPLQTCRSGPAVERWPGGCSPTKGPKGSQGPKGPKCGIICLSGWWFGTFIIFHNIWE
jgi:hypothetical protein